MRETYAYFYFMAKDIPNFPSLLEKHIAYWKDHSEIVTQSGPFSDRSGGLIVFEAANEKTAQKIAKDDPFVLSGALEQSWLKAWVCR